MRAGAKEDAGKWFAMNILWGFFQFFRLFQTFSKKKKKLRKIIKGISCNFSRQLLKCFLKKFENIKKTASKVAH